MSPVDRSAISMSLDDIDEMLASVRTMSIATIGADGRPHVVAMWFAVHDGLITFMAYRCSRKYRNLLHDNRVTCMVGAGAHYGELRGLQIRGRAAEVGQEQRLVAACAITKRDAVSPVDPDEVARQIRSRIVYPVTPVATVSWDHRKLAGTSQEA